LTNARWGERKGKMSAEFRIKQMGRYIHKCQGCGVYIKANSRFCRACVLDLLGGGMAGDWRDKIKTEQYEKRVLVLLHPKPDFTFA